MTAPPSPSRYGSLAFNAPMSEELADALATSLTRRSPAKVLDVGCGWGELLLRVIAASPSATALGIDRDMALRERGAANAVARALAGRVQFRAELPDPRIASADVVICVGADHIFGTQHDALRSLHELVVPGGRLLVGTGFWEQTPSREQAAALGATPEELRSLADLINLAMSAGFRVLDVRTASRREWEQFEFGYLADWEEWLMDWSSDAGAVDIVTRANDHRNGYLRGWRDVLGFAYLILGRPRALGS